MNCLFHDYCKNTTGYPKPSCHAVCHDGVKAYCPYHFQLANIISREGKLCGYELTSSWLTQKLTGKQASEQSLYFTLAYNAMLKRLLRRLTQSSFPGESQLKIFLKLPRHILMDTATVKQLLNLNSVMTAQSHTLVMVINCLDLALAPYTKQAEFLLKDHGAQFALTCNLDTQLKHIQPAEILLFSADELQHKLSDNINYITDYLFSLNEKGFVLTLCDTVTPENYTQGLILPFRYFKS
ncbi:hypothetical protein [Shewanella sp. GXUN23E]|uniref:hypothetical protein n=1 Tax=Shewanella sp. GXUN23E TaxID=3422498 RepID=UPI003D7C3B86